MSDDRSGCCVFFFFKQKTAYEIVSRDWSSDVCSSDLQGKALTFQFGVADKKMLADFLN